MFAARKNDLLLKAGLLSASMLIGVQMSISPAILASRLVFGAGVGLDCGLAMSMVGDFFEGQERATLMGVRSSTETIGNIACTTLAGVLLGFGWQSCFLVYGLLLVPVVLFALGVPARTPQEEAATRANQSKGASPKQRLNAAVRCGIWSVGALLHLRGVQLRV